MRALGNVNIRIAMLGGLTIDGPPVGEANDSGESCVEAHLALVWV